MDMTDGHLPNNTRHRISGIAFNVFTWASVVFFALFIMLRLLLLTPIAPPLFERALSGFIGQPVKLGALALSGTTVYLEKIAIESPAGFRDRLVLYARSLVVTPDPSSLLTGKRAFSLIGIDGLSVNLSKNDTGVWNFSGLLDRFKVKKPKAKVETFIGRLRLRNATVKVNGHGFDGLGLDLTNLSTKGTGESRMEISGRDLTGRAAHLTVQGRMGTDPSFHMNLNIPSLSLAPVRLPERIADTIKLKAATADISISAGLREGLLKTRGAFGVVRLGLATGKEEIPVRSSLRFSGRWDTRLDEAFIDNAILSVKPLSAGDSLTIRFNGAIRRIRNGGAFTLNILPDSTRLASLSKLVPETRRKGLAVDGVLTSSGCHLEGSLEKGITGGRADFSLRSASLATGKHLVALETSADIALRGDGKGWRLNGRVFSREKSAKSSLAALESLEAPFSASFSPRFKVIRMESPGVRAVVMGIPITGDMRYTPSEPPAFSCMVRVEKFPLSSLNRQLARWSTGLSAGTGESLLRLSGVSLQDFTGEATADLSAPSGAVGGKNFSLRSGRLSSTFRRKGGRFSAKGVMEMADGVAMGKKLGASLGYSLDGSMLDIRNCSLSLDRAKIEVPWAALKLPFQEKPVREGGIPLSVSLSGANIRYGDLYAKGLSGRFSGRFASPGQGITGASDLALQSLTFRDHQAAASLTGRMMLAGKDTAANLKGEFLGGTMDALIRGNLISRKTEVTFTSSLQGQRLERLQEFLPQGAAPSFSAGVANLSISGTYTREKGVLANLSGSGDGISLKGKTGKTLLSDVGLTLEGRISGDNLAIPEAFITRGKEIKARITCDMERFASTGRKGRINFHLPATPINSLLDAFANALPRNLQEAVCQGTCSMEGIADIRGRDIAVEGGLSLESASLEIASQKVHVTEISGRAPLSLLIPWKNGERKGTVGSFCRENYGKFLQNLGTAGGKGSRLTIGKIRFGAMEMGPLEIFTTAGNGITEIVSLNGSMYDGRLLGKGFILYGNGLQYGADLLLHDLSLSRFCQSFPSIKGYITGRVDGVISVLNVKGETGEPSGYVNLWTRAVKGEKMAVSKEFLQKLAGKKLRGFLFTNDRAYDTGEVSAFLHKGFITFEKLDISHTNLLGMKDLSVTVVAVQNRISLEHLLDSIREAAARGKPGDEKSTPIQTEFKWLE